MLLFCVILIKNNENIKFQQKIMKKNKNYNYDNSNEEISDENQEENTSSNIKDSNGTILNDGDTVHLIKDLKVKGSTITLKRGTMVKKIRLTNNDEEVDCSIEKMKIVLKTCFLKKA